LGVLDQLNNLRQNGVAPYFGGFKNQPSIFIERGTINRRTRRFFYGSDSHG
jgi:hypothetical protein